jgi:putative acetyltransferase
MKIVENEKKFLEDFIRLNEEWISTYFEIEEVDRKLAANPYQIVENGGHIFSLVSEKEVLGVCALFNDGDGVFELARMAVSRQSQGGGLGHKLMLACLAKLSEIGANKVYLVSNTKLASAIALYKRHGFKTVSQGQHPIYSRANIVMERHVL